MQRAENVLCSFRTRQDAASTETTNPVTTTDSILPGQAAQHRQLAAARKMPILPMIKTQDTIS
ncbi:MAG: hypothetical protein KAU94_12825 [Verrucomicrobia bacterium]|nr:hypothetical protein [Verrucomicrobiota bacterium]